MKRKIFMLMLAAMLIFTSMASADVVNLDRARNAAQNWIIHVIQAYGSWGGDSSPSISGQETITHNGVVVGYNFTVAPNGHVLVSARDDIPAVKLYSENATLSIYNVNMQEQIDWIAKEIFQVGEAIDTHRVELAAQTVSENPDRQLWTILDKDTQEFASVIGDVASEAISYGPLLSTTWNQPDPYNQQCPTTSSGCRTLVGCVATAASQIMKYWNYPTTGQGSTSYTWNNGSTNVTLSRNFASSTYDWANMPNALTGSSTATQKSAVAKLCADVGIAFHMGYGCSASGASTANAPNVFKTYFKYKDTVSWVDREDYSSASAWMKVFKTETQAGRPSQLRINDPSAGGHSIVVDGYRDSPSETVHLNMGWQGSYDGWYVPDSFTTGSYHWTDTNYQGAAIGIQPPTSTYAINSPTPGSTFTSTSVTFQWTPGAAGYWLYVGSSVGSASYYNSGSLGTATSKTVSGLPSNGSTVYVRFWYQATSGGGWGYHDYTYKAVTSSTYSITSPTAGSTLTSTTPTFYWTAGAAQYWLYIGSSVGSTSYYNSGSLGTASSKTVSGLPSNGSTVYVRFWYQATSGGGWGYKDYAYKAVTLSSYSITSPTAGSTLTSTTPTFYWTAGAAQYWLYIGSSVGSTSYYNSGSLGTATSKTVRGLPSNGSTVYVRFWYQATSGGGWGYKDYAYKAVTLIYGTDDIDEEDDFYID